MHDPGLLKILSWNVNGIRACVRKGFVPWLQACGADIVGVQEVRATEAQLPAEIRGLSGWHRHVSAAERKGYSGVGLFSRTPPARVDTSLDVAEFDLEGRVQIAHFGALIVANVYFPNGNGTDRDNSRVPFKLAFYRRLFEVLEPAAGAGRPVLVMGDFNTAHREIDLARPRQNQETSGFLPEERAEVQRWLDAGWVDTFRHLHPDEAHRYSWWSQRFGIRARNVGWRIDMALVNPAARAFLVDAEIHHDVLGSDHCPIAVTFEQRILDPTSFPA